MKSKLCRIFLGKILALLRKLISKKEIVGYNFKHLNYLQTAHFENNSLEYNTKVTYGRPGSIFLRYLFLIQN